MPYSNPITQNELQDLALYNPLHPRDGSPAEQYMPQAYFLVPPATQAGPVKWRLFDAAYITTGIIDPNRLGTGATGAGNLYLADDGTWKAVSGGGGGGAVDRIIAGTNISISPTGGTGNVTINATTLVPDPTGYGSFFSNQTQAISVINTPQVVTFNNTYEANDVYLSSNRIYFNKAGTYQFAYIAQVFNTSNDIEHCSFWIRYNGNNFPNSATHITVNARKSSTEPSEQQMKLILSGTAQNDGDYIELYWQGTTTSLSLGYVASGPGEAPVNSPSVIANIIPIGAQGRDSNLNELNDVTITSPLTGQLVRYNSGIWENWTPNFLTTVPTLDQVTTAGNITTNGIGVGGVSVGSPERAALSVLDNKGRLQLQSNTGTVDVDFVGGLFKYIAFGNLVIGTTIDSGYKLEVVGSLRATADTYLATTSGNVGIGTTSPTDKLFVQGNSTVTGYLGVHGILYHRSSFAVLNKAAGGWLFWANRNDSEAEVAMRLDYVRSINGTAGGAVGIGTTNPTLGTLHVEGTVYSTRFELPQGADLASGVAGIRVLDPFGGMYQYNNSGGYTGHFTSYHIRNTSAATMFYATSSAFGIGTTSPNARVHIEGGSANWNETTPGTATGTIHLDPGTAGANYGNGITFGAWDWNSGNNAQAGIYVRSDGLYGTKMYFATSNDYTAGSKTRLYIGESGNIGIGTISPSQQLQVTGKVLIGALDNYGDGNTKMYVHNPTSVNIVLNPNPNSADLYYRVKIGVDRSSTGSFYVDHEGARIIEAWNSGVYLNLSSVVSLGNKAWTLETNGYGLQMYSPFGWSSVVRFTNANSGTTSTDGALVGLIEGGTFRVWNYEDQPMLFATNNAERVRIAANGNVGIGANNPTSLLQVGVGQTTTNPLIKLGATYDSSRNVRGAISWDDSANITGKIHTEFDGTMVSMVFGSLYNSGYNSNNLMIIRGNGNIGIGTTSPTYKLDVVGDVRASGDVIALTNLKSMYQVGDEGGEIVLNKPVTGTVIDTSVTIDVFQNKVRIFETGGLNRGGYFDLSALGNSVGTNLARTGWTGTIFIATNPPGQQNITVEGGLITGFGA
jgi:hypothetical protein